MVYGSGRGSVVEGFRKEELIGWELGCVLEKVVGNLVLKE